MDQGMKKGWGRFYGKNDNEGKRLRREKGAKGEKKRKKGEERYEKVEKGEGSEERGEKEEGQRER